MTKTTETKATVTAKQTPIEEVVVAIAGCGIELAKRQAAKMNDGDQSKLRAAYESKKNPRGVLQAILDRQANDTAKAKGDAQS